MPHKQDERSPRPSRGEPDWDGWGDLEFEGFDEKPADEEKPWRVQIEGFPANVGILSTWVAFFAVYGVVAPRDSLWSAIGVLLGLVMLLVVIFLKVRKCRSP